MLQGIEKQWSFTELNPPQGLFTVIMCITLYNIGVDRHMLKAPLDFSRVGFPHLKK
ncbi:MAG: hypothetical protein JWM14_2791 [Chitinophagaceae bacterium]|nr:hypothetical protein [Chitinophagaceae bacterium]